jgi:hypothetical protein
MNPTFAFDCYRSMADGWVAAGTLQGMAGGSFEERPLWYGCQADTWPELQAGICRLVEVLRPRVDPNPRTTAIEATVRAWPEGRPLLLPPAGNPARLFGNLVNVGTRRRAWVENADEVQIVSFLKVGALAIIKPKGIWKPELVSSFLGFAIGLVPEHPTPIPQRAGQTPADLVEEILLGGREDN